MTAFVPFVQKCLDSKGGSIHASETPVCPSVETRMSVDHRGLRPMPMHRCGQALRQSPQLVQLDSSGRVSM